MPPLVLTILKVVFVALLYLFIARAVRVIYLDLVGPRVPRASAKGSVPAGPRKRRGQPKSLVVTDAEGSARTYPIAQDPMTIGRADGCQIVLADTYASQMHARVFPKDGSWFVEDLGSTNGTYLNRAKVTAPSEVGSGDEIRIGKTTLEFRR